MSISNIDKIREKVEKLKKLADAMYYAAQYLTTDASRLHKAMDEYHKFIIHECKEEPASEEWIEELRTKLDSLSKEDFEKVFDKYAIVFNEEPVSEDLGEAAENYATTDEVLPNGKVMINFQAEKAFRAGANWQKEQLLAKAVDGEVTYGKSLAIPSLGYRLDKERLDFGDKVKVIVIKE